MRKIAITFIFMLISPIVYSNTLPGGHELKQNDKGEYFVVNSDDVIMIEAAIMQMGYSSRWILACIKHQSIDSDLKRWVFVDVKNGGTFDSLNQENWRFFSEEAYPELKEIKLQKYSEESCP